ncbi:MAG: hypothetical protein FWG35_02220 [Spirochaetaceae bacterium]|nr:hypothetical protein [Spirochaetaceae bacterium]
MGATVDEIVNDYLQSYNSIFDSSIYNWNEADSLVVMKILSAMGNTIPVNDQNLPAIAEHYLRNTVKLSSEEVRLLKIKLANCNQ